MRRVLVVLFVLTVVGIALDAGSTYYALSAFGEWVKESDPLLRYQVEKIGPAPALSANFILGSLGCLYIWRRRPRREGCRVALLAAIGCIRWVAGLSNLTVIVNLSLVAAILGPPCG